MTTPYQVPAEMRDLAEKSVKQARQAFEGFMGAVHQGAGKADETVFSAGAGLRDASQKAVSYAENNVRAAFDLAEKLCQAKDFQEVVALQTEFVKSQMGAFQAQAREFGETVQNAAKDAAKGAAKPTK